MVLTENQSNVLPAIPNNNQTCIRLSSGVSVGMNRVRAQIHHNSSDTSHGDSLEKLEGFHCESSGREQLLQVFLADRRAAEHTEGFYNMPELWTPTRICASEHGNRSHGMLERCKVADGGKMLLKFLEPGFLKRWRAEPEKSRVSTCSSWPAPPRGSCTTGCLDNITRITLPWRRWPFR